MGFAGPKWLGHMLAAPSTSHWCLLFVKDATTVFRASGLWGWGPQVPQGAALATGLFHASCWQEGQGVQPPREVLGQPTKAHPPLVDPCAAAGTAAQLSTMHSQMVMGEGQKLRPGPDSPQCGECFQPLSHRSHLCAWLWHLNSGFVGCRTVSYTRNLRNLRPDSDSSYQKTGGTTLPPAREALERPP